jgi:hypothetical protein
MALCHAVPFVLPKISLFRSWTHKETHYAGDSYCKIIPQQDSSVFACQPDRMQWYIAAAAPGKYYSCN